ncbi:MAG: HD domain-containing protein [Bdellovibrionales bacterium]|nr:HD domain-containing protein [Bdellovibrionales bacterium]
MSSVKNLEQYFEAQFLSLVADRELTFDVCIYFKRNNHLVVLKRSGDAPTAEFMEKYKGIGSIWIDKKYYDAYQAYLKGEEAPPAPIESLIVAVGTPAPEMPGLKVVPPADLPEATPPPPDITPEQREELLLNHAQTLVAGAFSTGSLEKQAQMDAKIRSTVKDILDQTAENTMEMIGELWSVSAEDESLNHGINVGAYAVLLSMAFGKIDNDLLGDIALAGILHDIGLSSISRWSIPEQLSDPQQMTENYRKHVELGLKTLRKHGTEASLRVQTLLEQHHEKFDGSGFPQSLQGFHVDDVAQLLAMANLLEEISSGQWDGKKRSRKQAIEEIERLEKTRTHPQFFNPDVLSAVLKWVKSEAGADAGSRAIEVVQSQIRGLLKAS